MPKSNKFNNDLGGVADKKDMKIGIYGMTAMEVNEIHLELS